MILRKGILKDFNAGDYTATVQLDGSPRGYLEAVTVAGNLSVGAMVHGRKVVVAFFDESNAREAVVIAVYE